MTRVYTCRENMESRRVQVQTPGVGGSVFTLYFTVFPSSGTVGAANDEYGAAWGALQSHLGVAIGKLTGIDQYETSGGDTNSPFGILGSVRSVNMEPQSDGEFVYQAVVVYQTEFPVEYDATSAPNAIVSSGQACINFSSQAGSRSIDLYKMPRLSETETPSAALPTIAEQTAAQSAGGLYHDAYRMEVGQTYQGKTLDSLDIGGTAYKRPCAQYEVIISEPWASRSSGIYPAGVGDGSATYLGQWPQAQNSSIDAFLYKRNNAEFLGFPAGTLLYTGTGTQPRQFHSHTLTHRFLYDEFQHFEQLPLSTVLGVNSLTQYDSGLDSSDGTDIKVQVIRNAVWINHHALATFADFVWGNAATANQVESSNGFARWDTESGPVSK